jgi:hypothetical protein
MRRFLESVGDRSRFLESWGHVVKIPRELAKDNELLATESRSSKIA